MADAVAPEVVARALRFLEQRDVHAFRQVCGAWRDAADEADSPWQNVAVRGEGFTPRGYAALLRQPLVQRDARRVSLSFCERLTSWDLGRLRTLPSLTELHVNGCHKVGSLEALAEAAPPLRLLSLYWMPQLADGALAEAAVFAPRLERLGLSGAKHLSDEALSRALGACGALEDLDLTRVPVKDGALEAAGLSCPRLRVLRLYAVNTYTDRGVCAVAAGCPLLQTLDMTGACAGLSDDGVAEVARRCPRLSWLALAWCTRLGDASLEALGAHSAALEHLNVHGNANITDAGVRALAAGCRRLQHADLNGCVGVAVRDLAGLRKQFPMLRSLAAL